MELTQKAIRHLIKEFTGQDNVLVIPRLFIDFTGDHLAALLLNQIIYWSERTSDPDGWFYKSAKDWQEELALTAFQVNRAVRLLKPFGVETKLKRANAAPTLHYRIDHDVFHSSIFKFLENRETSKSRNLENVIEETQKSDFQETSKTLTETTTEITPKRKRGAAKAAPAPRQLDLRAKAPAIQACRDVLGKYPNKVLWDMIISTVTDIELWKKVMVEWVGKYDTTHNIKGMLDWYTDGIPQWAKSRKVANGATYPASSRFTPVDQLKRERNSTRIYD